MTVYKLRELKGLEEAMPVS